jgi:hypothetical protein
VCLVRLIVATGSASQPGSVASATQQKTTSETPKSYAMKIHRQVHVSNYLLPPSSNRVIPDACTLKRCTTPFATALGSCLLYCTQLQAIEGKGNR